MCNSHPPLKRGDDSGVAKGWALVAQSGFATTAASTALTSFLQPWAAQAAARTNIMWDHRRRLHGGSIH